MCWTEMSERSTELSKLVSYALRHAPWKFELEMDAEGWVPVDQLLVAIREDPLWGDLSRQELEAAISSGPRQRHEISGDRIRALYGHSIPTRITREPVSPPDKLFHGTAGAAVPSIMREGLLPRGRQYVHLSATPDIALQVGRRKDPRPSILEVDSRGAHDAGVYFYRASDDIYLADRVPAVFLRVLP